MSELIARAEILKELANINAVASSLSMDLEDDLTPEDIAAGAEPLTPEQIQAELKSICSSVTLIALEHLKAEGEEWIAVNDSIA
ncbi:hypothetical protein [Ruegeria atlantica]|uniref:hypothetical protein n=1 Tax=Ruegeria atlantica TaxID=81569 RepID=UPI00147CC44D|nr:hypothetical protein [Ruegeria atlantica]